MIMTFTNSIVIITALLASSFPVTRGSIFCEKVEALQDLDIDEYASARWFIQEQSRTFFSPPSQTCVRADYKVLDEETSPWGYTIEVNNQQGKEENDGDPESPLCAYQVNEGTGQLAVAPCFLPKIFAGAYWVVAYDESEGFALVSGGQPRIPAKDGLCRTGKTYYNSGLFILTRQQARNDELVEKVKGIAENLGISTSGLNTVDHTDC